MPEKLRGGDHDGVRARSLKFLDEIEDHKYQPAVLPGGVTTPGYQDREYLMDALFGDDFKGRSLLDIGSNLGYFCIEAMRRSASEAVGVEFERASVRHAQAIADLWSLPAEFVEAGFEEWNPDGRQFDTVSCLNVLHHMFDPIHALRKMMSLTRRKLVLEIAVPTWRDVRRQGINPLRLANVGAPAIFLGVPKKRGPAAGRTFLMTPKALQILFNTHSTAFEPIIITRSPFKGRMVVEARKRQIGHLVIVSGPTSVGKSTFCARLVNDPSFAKRFGMAPEPWIFTGGMRVKNLPNGRLDRVLFHYDMLRMSRSGREGPFSQDPALHIMDAAQEITVLTLMASPDRLCDQLTKGELQDARRVKPRQRQRDLMLLERYKREIFLRDQYDAWVAFCDRHTQAPVKHDLVINDGKYVTKPIKTWSKTWAGYFS